MKNILEKYADLLVNYCLEIKPGERLLVKTTTLAEPLVREIFKKVLENGAMMDTQLAFREEKRILFSTGSDFALNYVSPIYEKGLKEYEAFLVIRAPFNIYEDLQIDQKKLRMHQKSLSGLSKIYSERTATRELKRCLCQYPTQAAAQFAQMSFEEYEQFVFDACNLYHKQPIAAWEAVSEKQQVVVDLLNEKSSIHYLGEDIDIQFATKGRTWINSDGKTNMPSGEVFTSPIEDSVNGYIHFSYPSLFRGHDVENVKLWVKDGYIEKWDAKKGKEFLDQIFDVEGTRRFGEVAIGTNYKIKQRTRNILFDEKIGGTIHMAIGQSYLQTGGKNNSPIHWDMVTDMTKGGAIFADGEKIYENGHFTSTVLENF